MPERSAGRLHGVRGELRDAVRLLERALALCRDWNLPTLSPITAGFLGSAYALSGRVAEGLPLLNEGRTAHEAFRALILAQMAEASLRADRMDDAVILADQALTLARERRQRGYEAWILRLLGEIAFTRDQPDVDRAETNYHDARALAGDLRMRPLQAHCHLGLGNIYGRTGDEAKAKEQLTIAATMYREMGMDFWLADAAPKEREPRGGR